MTGLGWYRLRRAVQAASLLLFLYLFLATVQWVTPILPVDLFFRLDLLAALSSTLAGREFPPKFALAGLILLLTLALGRAWCGWLCPLGTVLDLVRFRRAAGGRPRLSPRWRSMKYALLLVILSSALLANQTAMVLDPITILTRTLATVILPALNVAVTTAERTLYPFSIMRGPLDAVDGLLRGVVLPYHQAVFQANIVIALIFGGILGLNWVAERFWCRYLCPLGGLLALIAKVSWLRRVVGPGCNRCRACARECPMDTADPARDFASDPGECIVCMACVAACPQQAHSFQGRWGLGEWRDYDPSRRQVLAALGLSVTGVVLMRTTPAAQRDQPYLVRPPGAREADFLARCIRCGKCMKVCPTSGLQPSLLEGGPEAFWTPVLVPRLGYCDYGCNQCGQVCPSGAIPPLSLEAKREAVIGHAYIDRSRCIPWVSDRNCIVCEEMCPVPEKAVKLEELQITDEAGEPMTLLRPSVRHDLCIGCGICEYQCPLEGQAAIRVQVPSQAVMMG
jgi:polyferredoxin